MNALDLYAKIEPLIGFYDEYEQLYSSYLQLLHPLNIKKILDIGCGNGKFSKHLLENDFEVLGIDRSDAMIKKARKLGVNAKNIELSDIPAQTFDGMVCIGDVLNYMQQDELEDFMAKASEVLLPGGYLLADINTLHGFEMSDGSIIKNQTKDCLAIDAIFDENILKTEIIYFEKIKKHYHKHSNVIFQYYHPLELFAKFSTFKLLRVVDITMFSDQSDKNLLIFQKTTSF